MNTIHLPNGRRVTVGAYVAAWKRINAMTPDTTINGWDAFETTAGRVRTDMIVGMMHRINRHDRAIRHGECSESRLITLRNRAVQRGAITMGCKWCGATLNAERGYIAREHRFCGPECRSSYYH